MKRLVIVPALNEAKSIGATLNQLKGLDVVVCDGGSKDRTRAIAKRKGAIVLYGKSGYGKVILNGMRYGLENGYDQMIVMDCESHTFKDIEPYLGCGADVIAGKRGAEKKPLIRKIITRVGRKMVPKGVKPPITDISNGFRAYSRAFVERLLKVSDIASPPSYTWNSIVAFYMEGWNVVEFPMHYVGGKSGLNAWELLKAWSYRVRYRVQTREVS